jgi:sugar O-acyltransferase (sialic acid O-acetyltransferase NeuD family)
VTDETEKVWIIGAGGHGKVVIAGFEAKGQAIAGVFDDDLSLQNKDVLGHRVLGPTPPQTWWKEPHNGFIAVGCNSDRRLLAERLRGPWALLLHPSAEFDSRSSLGTGCYIGVQAVVQPGSSIGQHVIINTGAIVEHDCYIDSYAHVASRACLAGAVTIGQGALIGSGAVILPGVRVGAWSVVGAGAVVVSDIPDGVTAIGAPARRVRRSKEPRSWRNSLPKPLGALAAATIGLICAGSFPYRMYSALFFVG